MIRGILLDVDGTLVLSNDAHAHAWVDAFREAGRDIPFERIRPLIGMGGDKLMPTVVPDLSTEAEPGKSIAERRTRIFLERYAPDLDPAPGARDLVEWLRSAGFAIGVATSAKAEELDAILKAANVQDLIEVATTSSDAEESKPDPDIVAAALEKLDLPAASAILIGDTPYDIEAAGRAGVRVIALRCGGFPEETLSGALAVFDDPAALLTSGTIQAPA
jgi:HAD superfamily hydrolase (TIGR01509 family)